MKVMKSEVVFTQSMNKLKTRYLHQRQAPQEILEPNEINEDMEEEGGETGKMIGTKGNNPEDEESQNEGDNEEEKMSVVRCEFNEVKLCSRNGAFLIEKLGKGTFIQYSTQNSRIKGEVAKQKL